MRKSITSLAVSTVLVSSLGINIIGSNALAASELSTSIKQDYTAHLEPLFKHFHAKKCIHAI